VKLIILNCWTSTIINKNAVMQNKGGKMEAENKICLCFRCEFRARFHETGSGPRHECKMDYGVRSCYMYRPVRPCLLEPLRKDIRPRFGPSLISSRERCAGIADGSYVAKKVKGNVCVLYWTPNKRRRNESDNRI
jgi:hypothetical protein